MLICLNNKLLNYTPTHGSWRKYNLKLQATNNGWREHIHILRSSEKQLFTWRHTPEGFNIHQHRCGNLRPRKTEFNKVQSNIRQSQQYEHLFSLPGPFTSLVQSFISASGDEQRTLQVSHSEVAVF